MNNYRILLFCLIACTFHHCTDDAPNNPHPPVEPVDTCYNDAPISAYDSVTQQYPNLYSLYQVSKLHISNTSGLWSGVYNLNGWDSMIKHGVFIYDPSNEIALTFLPGWGGEWSKDGKRLLLDNGFNGFRIYDTDAMAYTASATFPQILNFTDPRWSLDEQWIYGDGNDGLYRVRPDGSGFENLYPGHQLIKQLDSTHFAGFNREGLLIFDSQTQTNTHINFPSLQADRFNLYVAVSSWSLSPDKTKILADIYTKAGFFAGRSTAGVFLFDLQKKTATKVLPQQYWGTPYYPTWATNSSFSGSYFCRTKSTSSSVTMVWEYDLQGNPIRQVTYPWMVLYPM